MYALAKYVVKNDYAAFFAGIVFTFSAFHIAQAYSHIDWLAIGWVPLALYFLLKMLEDGHKYRNAIGLGVSLVLSVLMGDVEQGIMAALMIIAVLAAYLISKRGRVLLQNKQFWQSLGLAIVLAIILGSWGFIPILSAALNGTSGALSQLNDIPHNELYSDSILSFFVPSYYNGIFNSGNPNYFGNLYSGDPTERTAYVGYTVIALVLYALYKDRKSYKLWLGILIIFGWMSLGPFVQLISPTNPTPIPGIFYVYHILPFINVIREPGRFYLIFSIALSILAAFGLKDLIGKYGVTTRVKNNQNMQLLIVGVLCAAFLVESAGLPLTSAFANLTTSNATVPNFYTLAGKQLSNTSSVLILPVLPDGSSASPNLYPGLDMYYGAALARPIIGGYARQNNSQVLSVYDIPLAVQALDIEESIPIVYQSPVQENYTNETLLTLYNYNTSVITINKQAYSSAGLQELEQMLYNTFGNDVYNANNTIAFSTSAPIAKSVFRSYVAYPSLDYWEPNVTTINNTEKLVWLPVNSGPILVYAPYANSSAMQAGISQDKQYSISTVMSFNAVSLSGSGGSLSIMLQGTQSNSPSQIAKISVGGSEKSYSVTMNMTSGPIGNGVFFIPGRTLYGSQSYIAISNITFQNKVT